MYKKIIKFDFLSQSVIIYESDNIIIGNNNSMLEDLF